MVQSRLQHPFPGNQQHGRFAVPKPCRMENGRVWTLLDTVRRLGVGSAREEILQFAAIRG